MNDFSTLLKGEVPYVQESHVVHFIADEDARPAWSRALDSALQGVDLQMARRYASQRRVMTEDPLRRRYIDFLSEARGVKVDLASGPSGYFAAMLDRLTGDDTLIVTDACPAVIAAHADACRGTRALVFDVDLDKPLPFRDESIDAFSGNLLNNVEHYAELLREVYRCLKPGGRFAAIELFFEQGSRTFEHLNAQGAVWSSYETYVSFCESLGFRCLGSDVLQTRVGKISEGDLYPLDPADRSTDRTIYFKKP